MHPVTAEIEGLVELPVVRAFDALLAIDVTKILVGRGLLPAVTAVEGQTGEWNAAGCTRTFRLADGSGLREQLKAVDPPHHFAYRVTEITGPLGRLVVDFAGGWWLAAEGDARTRVRWRYEFRPRSRWTRPLAVLIVSQLWRPYITRALALARAQIEGDATSRGAAPNAIVGASHSSRVGA